MMNVIETNESHFQLDSSCDQINPSIFADQPLSRVFDCSSNMNSNSLCNNMDGVSDNSMGLFDTDQNRLLIKQIRNKNTKDFKELVANFWGPTQNSNNSLQNEAMPSSLPRKIPSSDAFGDFHPIDLTSKKTKNSFTNGRPNATMDMRIPLKVPSSGSLFLASNTMNKTLFRPDCANSNMNIGSSSTNMMPPAMKDDSIHSHQSWRKSATDIINAATNIVNGNEIDNIFPSNKVSGINTAPINYNKKVVAEPGPYDIVCGRNSGAYNFIGNRRFRVTIEMNLQRYIDSPTREDKTKVIKSIVGVLHDQIGARFLKKETCKTVSADGTLRRRAPRYIVMSDKQAREKVGHALRDLVIASRREQEAMKKKKQQQEQAQKATDSQ